MTNSFCYGVLNLVQLVESQRQARAIDLLPNFEQLAAKKNNLEISRKCHLANCMSL
jgi:hypothetical protein